MDPFILNGGLCICLLINHVLIDAFLISVHITEKRLCFRSL